MIRKRHLMKSRSQKDTQDSHADHTQTPDTKPRSVRSAASSSAMSSTTTTSSASSSSSLTATSAKPRTVSSTAPGEFTDPRTLTAHSVLERDQVQPVQGILARPKVVQFPEREHERHRARLSSLAIRITLSVLAVSVASAIIWALCFSSLFALHSDKISISGTNTWVSQQTVEDLVVPQTGKSLLLINAVNIENNIRNLPGVTNAQVTKEYPHGITVAITAQVPAAILQSGDTLVAVDSKSRKLNNVHASVQGIPVIHVRNIDEALQQSAVSQAITVLSSLDESLRKRISTVEAQTRDSIVTKIDNDAISIIWGDASKIKLKRAIVETLLSQPNTMNGSTTINVSAPDRPTIK